MRRTIFIFLLLIGVISCDKNDNNADTSNPLIGIWQLEEEIEQGKVVGKSQPCFYLRTGNPT